ncbi:hypothetical protein UFOVP68_48 [uncultured Caudovirales phage]|uniref:Uncharacterized protein n=1 Tax=uncultured Caudovirales phage TaxID=2100421 RepID=A0A6J5KYY1_9CAUD|nr:hypothetical protein UFOVP68_48 [uncultured Caudovirales phage]
MAEAGFAGDRGVGGSGAGVAVKRKTPARAGRPASGGAVRVRYPYLAVDLQRCVVYKDQLFMPGGQKAIPSNRGKHEVRVDFWSSHCAECGALYSFYTMPRDERLPFGFLRRCETHRAKGKPIDAARFAATRPAFQDVADMVREGKAMWFALLEMWREQDVRAELVAECAQAE